MTRDSPSEYGCCRGRVTAASYSYPGEEKPAASSRMGDSEAGAGALTVSWLLLVEW